MSVATLEPGVRTARWSLLVMLGALALLGAPAPARAAPGDITTVAGSGTAGFSGDGGLATAAKLDNPASVAPTPDGGFLIGDFNNFRIRRVEGVPTPTVRHTNPPSSANQKAIRIIGSALATATARIYADADCSGRTLASGTGAQFAAAGIPVTVPNNSTTTFYAQASQNGYTSACSKSSVTYVEDSRPPKTGLTKAKINSKSRTAKFIFTSNEPDSRFQCRFDEQKKFSKCRSPKTYKHLNPGKHRFLVRATDTAGNTDKTSAKRVLRIKRRR